MVAVTEGTPDEPPIPEGSPDAETGDGGIGAPDAPDEGSAVATAEGVACNDGSGEGTAVASREGEGETEDEGEAVTDGVSKIEDAGAAGRALFAPPGRVHADVAKATDAKAATVQRRDE